MAMCLQSRRKISPPQRHSASTALLCYLMCGKVMYMCRLAVTPCFSMLDLMFHDMS